jgi:hypothetical protein
MLGHSDLATTGKYAHAMIEDMRVAMEAAVRQRWPAAIQKQEKELRLSIGVFVKIITFGGSQFRIGAEANQKYELFGSFAPLRR